MADKKQAYRAPASVTNGVSITLDQDDSATFVVALPVDDHIEFERVQRGMTYAAMPADVLSGTPAVIADWSRKHFWEIERAQVAGFIETCILTYPDGWSKADLQGEFQAAAMEVYEKATALAQKEDAAAQRAAGKSRTT